jgi:hypothetical protein
MNDKEAARSFPKSACSIPIDILLEGSVFAEKLKFSLTAEDEWRTRQVF